MILGALLLTVIVLGEKKQAKESRELLSQLNEIQTESNKEKENIKPEEKQPDTEVVKKEYKYEGPNALGQYNNNRWKSKKWYVVGENTKNTTGYVNRIKTLTAINTAVIDADDSKAIGDMVINITADKLKDIDLVTVLAGTNDYSLGIPLGTINDDENAATFYGSLKKLINTTITAKPGAAIVFITPLKQFSVPNKNGVGLDKYVQAIDEVCKFYNILVLDLYSKSGIDEKNIKSYTTANSILNTQGIQKVSQLISDFIKTIK